MVRQAACGSSTRTNSHRLTAPAAAGVCDDPPYFYAFMQGLLDDMGATAKAVGVLLLLLPSLSRTR